MVRKPKMSCREIAEAFIKRLKKKTPKLHCVITMTEARALAQDDLLDAMWMFT
jgi:Asp-tRNA(Asn)/Glu-tRNA(Gln) amidotransferase A subunit family amidase